MPLYTDIISGRRRGLFGAASRAALRTLSLPYCGLVNLRNAYYDTFANLRWLDRPCISIGNITTGGTGKTPLVIWLAGELIHAGKKVAIISRGYKGNAHGNEELELVSSLCPKAICIANPNRVVAGHYAVEEHDVDVIILDDAFQHRRVDRDLNVLLLDSACPFGFGHILPRGLLREPVRGLDRAHVIVMSHISRVSPDQLADLKSLCARHSPDAEILGCEHRPTGLLDAEGRSEDISQLSGAAVLAFAGIGNPVGFVHTLTNLGAKPRRMIPFADHHHYDIADCRRITAAARSVGAEILVTTEKDMVKLRRLEHDWPVTLRSLQIKIDFAAGGGKMLLALVDELFEEPCTDDSATV
ncbi:MAG: tetraacyldisaccharide 4'-kinase [Planctomycetota bacterium]|nr:tetraacyldisaccharide 4'-kinase [Planctomycetota bacterium]